MSITTSRTQPALVGGLVMGVLSVLPFIGAANVCCCLWVVAGGVVAAYLLQQNQTAPLTPGDGALVGLLAGLAGAVVFFVLSIPIDLMLAPLQRAMVERVRDMAGSMPPEIGDLLDRYGQERDAAGPLFFVFRHIVGFIFMLFAGAVFSTLGGLLGAAIFRKPSAPPGVIDVPPSDSSR